VVELVDDFVDLLRCLQAANVEYLLIGGYALNAYGVVRATEDLDVFVNPDEANLQRVLYAMDAFGAPPGLTLEALRPGDTPPTGFRFGRPPIGVDLLTSVAGISFEDAQEGRIHVLVRGLTVPVVGREALRRNKAAAGRLRDLADLEALGEG